MNKRFSGFCLFVYVSLLSIQATAEGLAEVAPATNNNKPISDARLLIAQNDFTLLGGDAI